MRFLKSPSSCNVLQLVNDASLRRQFRGLLKNRSRIKEYEQQLNESYAKYVQVVSTPTMAVSLQTAALLAFICENMPVSRVLDLGSGFSSFVLRTSTQRYVEVWSVDDNNDWLNKTRTFLKDKGVQTDHLYNWLDFSSTALPDFDLIFHDLGSMDTRLGVLPQVIEMARKGNGLLILDDMHKRNYAEKALKTLKVFDFKYWNLKSYTLDDLSRFSGVTIHKTYKLTNLE